MTTVDMFYSTRLHDVAGPGEGLAGTVPLHSPLCFVMSALMCMYIVRMFDVCMVCSVFVLS